MYQCGFSCPSPYPNTRALYPNYHRSNYNRKATLFRWGNGAVSYSLYPHRQSEFQYELSFDRLASLRVIIALKRIFLVPIRELASFQTTIRLWRVLQNRSRARLELATLRLTEMGALGNSTTLRRR